MTSQLFSSTWRACVWTLILCMAPAAFADDQDNTIRAADLIKPKSRPARPALAESKLPLEFIQGERIALVGNSTAERMNLFGHWETLLHARFPDKELVVRNFARPADEVGNRQRSADYTAIDDPLSAFGADTFICFFGWNESFAGEAGLASFKEQYEKFLDEYAQKYPRDDTGAKPRFVLVGPIAFEPTNDPLLPDGKKQNEHLAAYSRAVKEVAQKRNLAFIDLFESTRTLFEAKPGMDFTINGCHLNEAGDRELALLLDKALFGSAPSIEVGSAPFERLRRAVNDKSWHHLQDYRMLNGWYVYGGRRTWDIQTFPREYVKIRRMVAVRDRYIWGIAQGKEVPPTPDDSKTGDLYVPKTRFGSPMQRYSEAEALRYLSPEEFISSCEVPPGFELKLFADERMFPELAKPVQISFDSKGRLWVATMPTYPQWRPGDPPPADKLLILEDTDRDGKADKCTTFYDKLHCPTGFEFYDGGVLVVDQPRLIWIKDTDGDDKADRIVHFLDGFATDDTHHTVGAFESNHGGLLHMLEGVAMSTAVETPHGPFRNYGSPGAYVLDPRTLELRHFITPGYGNPWCYVFDQWGQGVVGDGTGAVQHWDTPLSGSQVGARRGLNPIFNNEGMRPCIGSEFLISSHYPDNVQGQFIYACVINMNGIPRFEIHDDGAGFGGSRLKKDGAPFDLVRSRDKHFRPVDPQIGPDGALWFGDWANALIGHMQYSQRDPNRDHQHGRIYRLVATDKPLVEPVTQHGKSNRELLDQLKQYEWRTRQRARSELRARPSEEVLRDVAEWVNGLKTSEPEHDRLLCEALWVQQSHHAPDRSLIDRILSCPTFQARAAATRVVADQPDRVTDAFAILVRTSQDAHPRVRTEAIRGLSFYSTAESVGAMLAASKLPLDYWTEYTLEHALGSSEGIWKQPFQEGKLAADNPLARMMLANLLSDSQAGRAAAPYLRTLLGPEKQPAEVNNKAISALEAMKGNADTGRKVFLRSCTGCHKLGNEGKEFGPDITKVAAKLNRFKLIESVIDPNAEVDPKFLSTSVLTTDGKQIAGLLVRESAEEVVLYDGKEEVKIAVGDIDERAQLKQSSMPEGLGGSLAPAEFLDLIEFLATLK